MGGIFSYFWGPSLPPDYDVPDSTGLTPRDKQNVKDVWELVLKKGVREMGVTLFRVFFELYPEHRKYFKTFQDTPLEKLKDNKMVRAHSSNVMYSITGIVGLLDDTEALVENLLKLGKSHNPRNISQQAFEDLRVTTNEMFKRELGNQYTKEREESWNKTIGVAWSVIFQTLNSKAD